VYENGVGKHYVNGVEEMSGRVPYIPVENADVSIGMRMNRVWYFKGAIRSVSMTRHALRPGEFTLLPPGASLMRPDSTEHLLFADDFSSDSSHWIAEFENPSGSSLSIRNGTLDISASAGATVWLNTKLTGNVLISYDVTVIDSGGRNHRVSDMNAFWMASEPFRADTLKRDPSRTGLPKRDGKFSSYDDLNLYYAGVGGHDNTTTRFRKYHAGGEKPVLQEYTDRRHLLEGNRVYAVAITVRDGRTTFSVNGVPYFEYADENPLTEGYFGFRTTKSHQRLSSFKVYRLASSLPH
jgi:rhamnogalacturonan endolyase